MQSHSAKCIACTNHVADEVSVPLKAAAGTDAQPRTEQTRVTQRMPARERNVQELLGVKDAWSMTR